MPFPNGASPFFYVYGQSARPTIVLPSKKKCFRVQPLRHVRILHAQLNIEQWRRAGEPRRNGFLPGSSSKTRRRADAE